MANLLQQRGDWEGAERSRLLSCQGRTITPLPFRGTGTPCRVLLLASAAGGNTPTRFLLDERRFETFVLAVEAFSGKRRCPNMTWCSTPWATPTWARRRWPRQSACWHAPGRRRSTRLTASAPRAAPPTPPYWRNARRDRAAHRTVRPRTSPPRRPSFGYPLLLRSPGYHTGQYFVKADDPANWPRVGRAAGRRTADDPVPGRARSSWSGA